MNDNPFNEREGQIIAVCDLWEFLGSVLSVEVYATPSSHGNVLFHNRVCLEFFCERVHELLLSGNRASWRHVNNLAKTDGSAFSSMLPHLQQIEAWLETKPSFSFYASGLDRHVRLDLSRRDLLEFAAIRFRHSTGRIKTILNKIAKNSDQSITDIHLMMSDLMDEISSRLLYLASVLVEMLGHLFLVLRDALAAFYETNHAGVQSYPAGIENQFVREYFHGVMSRAQAIKPGFIRSLFPTVPEVLKKRY